MSRRFSRLSVRGYRRLKHVDLELRPLNVLIGANGVGKTSTLEIFDLLAASAEGRLDSTINDLGGMTSILTADGTTDKIRLQVRTTEADAVGLSYDLHLVSQGYSYAIKDEVLSQYGMLPPPGPMVYADGADIVYQHDGQPVRPNWEYQGRETALSQVPKMYQEAESFRRLLADVSEVYHSLDVSMRAPVRTPQPLSPAQTPGVNGEDLISCLFTISQTEQDRFEAIQDALRSAFPPFERLEFPPVAAGRLALGWRETGFTRPFYANELSEGTLRFLWLATLLQSPGLPKITLIDEPEVSLHPELLRLLADLMREASERTQLVIATHSDRFVRFLEPGELIVCDRDEAGGMTVQRGDAFDLAAWMEDYTLDQLWSMGRLGGRS